MNYAIGAANVRWTIEGFYDRPDLRFDAYQLAEEEDGETLELVILTGDGPTEPIVIGSDLLRESETSNEGYRRMELYLESQVGEKLRWGQ